MISQAISTVEINTYQTPLHSIRLDSNESALHLSRQNTDSSDKLHKQQKRVLIQEIRPGTSFCYIT